MNMHWHVAKYEDGKLVDDCLVCGKSWRDTDVHFSRPVQPQDIVEAKPEQPTTAAAKN
jgi:hypothetical protein